MCRFCDAKHQQNKRSVDLVRVPLYRYVELCMV